MRQRRLDWFAMAVLVSSAILVWNLTHNADTSAETHAEWTDTLLGLRRAEANLDRDLLRVVSFRLQQYDPLVADYAEIRSLSEQARKMAQQTGGLKMPYGFALEAWLSGLETKVRVAQHVVSQTALVRNEILYLDTQVIGDGSMRMLLEHLRSDMLAYVLFDSELRRRDIEADIAAINAINDGKDKLFNNIVHHVGVTLRFTRDLHDRLDQYHSLDSAQRFEQAYAALNQYYVTQANELERRRFSLVLLTAALMLALGASLWRLARGREQAEMARRRLGDAVASLHEGFALFDAEGKLVLHNDAFIRCYPWLRENLVSSTTHEDLLRWNREHGVTRKPRNIRDAIIVPDNESTLDSCVEEFVDEQGEHHWLLASDSITGNGERVLIRIGVTEARRRERELAKLHRAVDQSPVSVVITDEKIRIEYVNSSFEKLTGYSPHEVMGKNPKLLRSGMTEKSTYENMWKALGEGRVWHGELRNRRKDGSSYWEETTIAPVRDSDNRTTHYVSFKQDISARKAAEELLGLHAAVFEALGEGVVITDADERILAVNPAFTRISGYSEKEVLGKTPRLLSSGHHDKDFYHAVWDTIHREGSWEGEIQDRRKNGEPYPAWISIAEIRDEHGKVRNYISVFRDISERKAAEEYIHKQANYDSLTGLPNRNLLQDRLDHALAVAQRHDGQAALIFIDLDRFKEVNDTLGHLVGDRLLQQVAERMRGCVRESDTVSRFGGDEFVILLEDIHHASDAARVARNVLSALSYPIVVAEHQLLVGASIGITFYPADAEDADTLLRNADMAMYRAKESGRNTYEFYTSGMNRSVQRKVQLSAELHRAIEEDELELHYQPIVQLADRRLVGFEALVRWNHPELGAIPPDQFIPLAEETGLISALGDVVLESACRQARVWMDQNHEWTISVNLSSRQLALGLSVDGLHKILSDTGLPPERLTLEFTEGLMLDGSSDTLKWMRTARALGIRLAIDDFGTGYSSLSYLKQYPMDDLKIDRSFVRDIGSDKGNRELVEAILAIAQSMDLSIVAEGIEHPEQLAFLVQHGCHMGQGYYFSRPLPSADIDEALEDARDRIRTDNIIRGKRFRR